MAAVKLPYTPHRGPLAGQTFHSTQSYNEALARAKGFASEAERRRTPVLGAARPDVFEAMSPRQRSEFNASLRVLDRVANGESLSSAAKAEGIRTETVQRFKPGSLQKSTSGYLVVESGYSGKGTGLVKVPTEGGVQKLVIPKASERKLVSRYWNGVKANLSISKQEREKGAKIVSRLAGKTITTIDGQKITLPDLATARRLALAGELGFDDFYPETGPSEEGEEAA